MWVRFDKTKILKDISKELERNLDKLTDSWLEKLKELTPEDSFNLQDNNSRSEVITVWNKIKTRIFNDSEYVEFVELSKTTKNYYKNSWRRNKLSPFVTSQGARMFLKTEDYIKNNIKKLWN